MDETDGWTVYVLLRAWDERSDLAGVYSTPERAREAARQDIAATARNWFFVERIEDNLPGSLTLIAGDGAYGFGSMTIVGQSCKNERRRAGWTEEIQYDWEIQRVDIDAPAKDD